MAMLTRRHFQCGRGACLFIRILVHVSLAWLCPAVHCSPSMGEEEQCCLYTLSSQQWGCPRAGDGQHFCSPALSFRSL